MIFSACFSELLKNWWTIQCKDDAQFTRPPVLLAWCLIECSITVFMWSSWSVAYFVVLSSLLAPCRHGGPVPTRQGTLTLSTSYTIRKYISDHLIHIILDVSVKMFWDVHNMKTHQPIRYLSLKLLPEIYIDLGCFDRNTLKAVSVLPRVTVIGLFWGYYLE